MIKKQDAFYKEQLARLEERVWLFLVSDSLLLTTSAVFSGVYLKINTLEL